MDREAFERAKSVYGTGAYDDTTLKFVFPELAESVDEKFRKYILKICEECVEANDKGLELSMSTTKKLLAYLEKQKESLHISETCKENADSFTDGIIEVRSFQRGIEEGRRLEKQKEQEHVCDSAQFEEGFKTGLEIGLRKQKEPKPAWSEEDERKRNELIKGLEKRMGFGWASDPYSREEYIDWLKSLPLNLKKKNEDVTKLCSNEWSEEDEEVLNLTKTQLRILQSHLSHTHSERMSDMEYSSQLLQIEKCVSWLDIRLKSLCPRLSWKPSKEQMDSLRDTIVQTKGYSWSMYLPELYEQLKKL